MNQINTVEMFFIGKQLVFTDESVGLKNEAMVAGSDLALCSIAEMKGIENWREGFVVTFSGQYFPDHDVCAEWIEGDVTNKAVDSSQCGNWYKVKLGEIEMPCWLCPALFKYFETSPKNLYVKVSPKC